MASYLDDVPFSGMIRIRDMMYSVERPFRLDQGDLSLDAPDTLKDALIRAVAENRTHYVQTTGIPPLLEALAAKLRNKNGIPIERSDEVMVTSGGIHGVFAVCHSLLEPGDEVLLPDPEWPPARGNLLAAEAVPIPYTLHASQDWRPDVEEMRRLVTPRTRAIYVNSPHNPTGLVLSRTDLQAIADLAMERDLWVLSDEAYEDLLFDGHEHVSMASLPGMADRVISIFTFSKTYAVTGLRLGYVVVPSAVLRDRMRKMLFYTVSNTSSLIQYRRARGDLRFPGLRWRVACGARGAARSVLRRSAGGGSRRPERREAGGRVLRVRAPEPRLALSAARRAGVAVMGDGGVPDQARAHRLRAGS